MNLNDGGFAEAVKKKMMADDPASGDSTQITGALNLKPDSEHNKTRHANISL